MRKKLELEGRPVWAEISLTALLHNLRTIRRHVGRKRKILAIVKANAYGLGAIEISKALERAGTEWFGVTSATEGAELRKAGIRQPILVLTGFWAGEEGDLLDYRLTPTVHRVEQLRLLERAAARRRKPRGSTQVSFHLKIDTGMNRLGIAPAEADSFLGVLAECPHLKLGGTYTHFASAETFTTDQTETQEAVFASAVARIRAAGVDPGIVHMANSGAICARPSTWADMVRPGAILYGYHQSFEPPERRVEVMAAMPLRPTLSLRTCIISLRDVPAGQGVGYGARFVTQRPSRIGVIAAGYADGLVRRRSDRGCVLVRGCAAPLVGVISMDLAALDLTDVPQARIGDVATIYGQDGKSSITVSEVAREVGSVTSDLLCELGTRVPRYHLL
jgi:alanine racemase